MSDVLIKGMGMPTSCHLCEFCIDKNAEIELTKASYICERTGSIVHAYAEGEKSRIDEKTGRIPECPLVEVPTHGRLVDLDALAEHIKDVYCKNCKRSKVMCKACEYGDMIDEIEDASTIIEASTNCIKERE